MTIPPAGATTAPAAELTHPCVRCGRHVPLDVAMCEICNPLGLEQPASSQVHGTVFVAIVLAVVVLAVLGRAALSGVGPFRAEIVEVLPVTAGLVVTIEVANDGSKGGATTCNLTRGANPGIGPSQLVHSQRIEPGQTRRVSTTTDRFGTAPVALAVTCQSP
ncbi:MAG TPA: hypothetical protein VM344_10805 [Vitreimonas sp.]|nr:hypothetical protein [Vitreimonas sp.]